MLKRGLVGYLPVNIVQALAGFGSIWLFTRLLSPTDYGDYAIAFSVTALVHTCVFIWIEAAMARFYVAEDEKCGRRALYGTLYRAFAVLMLIAPAVAAAVLLVLPAPTGLKLAIAAGVLSIVTRSLLKLAQERRRAAGDVRGFAVIDVAQTAVGFALGAALALIGWGGAAPLAGAGAASAVCLIFTLPAEVRIARQGAFDRVRLRKYAGYGMPLSLSLVMSLALATTDRFVLAGYMNEATVGAYHAGYTLSNRTLDVMFIWMGMAGQPACIAALERGGREALRRTALDQASMMVLIALPAAVGLALVSGPLAHVMIGAALAKTAATVTPWIAAGAFLSGMTTYYFNTAYTLARRTRLLFGVIAAPAVANFILVLVLVPRYGLMGAMIATVISYAIGAVVSILLAQGEIALPFPWVTAAKAGAAAALMGAAVWAAPAPGGLAELALKASLGVLVYGAAVLALDAGGARGRAGDLIAQLRTRRLRPEPLALRGGHDRV